MTEQRETKEKAKLVALKEAAAVGFRDIDEGRFQDIAEDSLEEFMSGLQQQARKRAKRSANKAMTVLIK